jgi:LmbE family N-acetylglucosaminyl deacetylase
MTGNKTALALLAHPDDMEILCAGTLIRLADAGWEIHVATATPGDGGSMTQSRWDIGSIRTNEAKKAAQLINATYYCLGQDDLFVIYDRNTVQRAIDLFRQVAPSLVIAHSPKDYLVDHEVMSTVARAASFAYGVPNTSTYPVKKGSGIPHLYYCDAIESKDALGNEIIPTTLIDITAQMDKKVEMLACHASQREWLRNHHGMDEYIDAMKRQGAFRGKQASVPYAEAFVQHLGHAHPQNDLLAELFAR